MSRLTRLTCDHCGRSVDIHERAELPTDWLELTWNVSPSDDADCDMCAMFCGWHCGAAFCAQMSTQLLLLVEARGRQPS